MATNKMLGEMNSMSELQTMQNSQSILKEFSTHGAQDQIRELAQRLQEKLQIKARKLELLRAGE